MRSLIFATLIVFGFTAGANTNGGGVFAVSSYLAEPTYVFKVGQTHDSVIYALGRFVGSKWTVRSQVIQDQELRSNLSLMDAIEESAETGKWTTVGK